jgi:spore coat polysaccharide biosynthesis protein SpsF
MMPGDRRARVVAIVQARMGSQRFPGKMLAELAGRPLLEWVLLRVRQSTRLDGIVVATSVDRRNYALADLSRRLGIDAFLGSEDDVLGRFCAAAAQSDADIVVRICADNPFVAAEEIDRVVALYLSERPDYAFNHVPRLDNNYADGFGAEVLSRVLLDRLDAIAIRPCHREHVTSYIWDHPDQFRIKTVIAPKGLAFPHLRFDIDEPDDLKVLEPCARAIGLNGSAEDFVGARLRELSGK